MAITNSYLTSTKNLESIIETTYAGLSEKVQ